jgi:hypothetical protein
MRAARRLILFVILAALVVSCGQCPPKPPPTPLVKVTVCGESLLLPNIYCPDVVVKEFRPDAVPTAICEVHVAPPDPPVIPVCASPWPETGKLRIWSGTLYSGLAGTSVIDETKLPALYDMMAANGANCERNFAWYCALEDGWAGTYLLPWNADWSWNEIYFVQLDRRLKMWCGDRNGAEIISILDACSMYQGDSWEVNPLNKLVSTPAEAFYPGPARDKVAAFARELVRRTAKYAPRIIYETRNEGNQIVGFDGLQSYDRAIIAALKLEGVPVTRMQVNWFDSSMFYAVISEDLEGDGLAATHQVNSEKSVDWWKTSPGKQALMAMGDYPCGDGPDFYDNEGAPLGLKWFWMPGGQARRPSNAQIAYIMATMESLGYPRFEHLSAAGFQRGNLPNLDDAIALGRGEVRALAVSLTAHESTGDMPHFRRSLNSDFCYRTYFR